MEILYFFYVFWLFLFMLNVYDVSAIEQFRGEIIV